MCVRRGLLFFSILAFSSLLTAATSKAQAAQDIEASWPREIESNVGKIVIYQPQLDTLEGNVVNGRAAVSLQGPGKKEPLFGALWFRSEISVDRDAGLVTVEDTKILRSKFPDATPEDLQKFQDIVDAEINKWDMVMTLEQVQASLSASQQEVASTENLKSDPPIIIFSQKPAVLVSFDGEPETRAIENSPYERVVNTAFLIIKDKNSGTFYLSNGQNWYTAKNPKGQWTTTTNPPAAIKDFVKPDPDAEPETGPPPQIITATEPTELIVTSGAPNWMALTGNALLYVSNTEGTMIKEIATNKYYLLLSGRWFSGQSLDGPWTYERSDQLPASFKQIAPASPIGDALTAVAGTSQADDADMDAEIPQTAGIKRDEAKVEVSYDGAPQFQDIPSTQIQYAVNTGSSVLKIGDQYYVCDNAVWFVGLTPNGPWVVADSVPGSVQSIPPSSPVYNVRYVHVYESTPQIVYVGYTPGYIGTYRYYGTVVYGTGWRYRPWIGPVYYYPRPYTWGFNVIYNPWSGGWGFALGYSTSFINVSIGWSNRYYHRPPYYGGGWWGPGGYRPIYRPLPGYRPPYRPPNNVIIIQPIRPGQPGYRPGNPGRPGRPTPYTRDNIYARPGTADRVAKDYRPDRKTPKPATKLPNNVYTDKNGNLYRRDNSGKWETRDNGKWTMPAPTKPETKPGTRPAPTTPETNPGTGPAPKPTPTKPQPKPDQPSIQPAPTPTKPQPTQPPTTRPAPKPAPTNPSIQPVPNNPSTRPATPTTRPAPKPTNPQTKPATPSIQPAPAPGLDRDAAARNRSRPVRTAPAPAPRPAPTQRPAPGNNQRPAGSSSRNSAPNSGSNSQKNSPSQQSSKPPRNN